MPKYVDNKNVDMKIQINRRSERCELRFYLSDTVAGFNKHSLLLFTWFCWYVRTKVNCIVFIWKAESHGLWTSVLCIIKS
jgi:hypothetical protein